MTLSTILPGSELYGAILDAFDDRGGPHRPIILEGPIIFAGERAASSGRDAIVVVSEVSDKFCLVDSGVIVSHPGALYYKNSREVLAYISKNKLVSSDVLINIQGIFLADDRDPDQQVFPSAGFAAFVDLGEETRFVTEARKVILRGLISRMDLRNSDSAPVVSEEIAKRYERDSTLVSLLKEIRGERCQICGFTFRARDGSNYCECHHLAALADGGMDVSKNMLVVCANCHRQLHYGNVTVVEHNSESVVLRIDGEDHTCYL